MKRIKPFLILAFLGLFLISANVGDMLVGKWKISKVTNIRTKKSMTDENMWMIFKQDGTLYFTEGDDISKKGEWAYDPDEKMLYISDRPDREDEVKIKKLTKKKLVLEVIGKAMVYLRRID